MSFHARALCVLLVVAAGPAACAQAPTTIPGPAYYLGFSPYFEGDYGTALDAFQSAARGGVRSTEGLWVDSICYHAMIGECYYRMGQIAKALTHYDSALRLAAFHNNWLLRVDFPEMIQPSASAVRTTISWGASKRNTRLARIPNTMASLQGRLDNDQVLKRGGVVAAPEYYPLNVKEVIRCTALALRRRQEIMGPVCQQDDLTSELVALFSRRPAPPNHWSQGWVSCQLGLAYAAAGKTQQAVAELNKSLVLAGQYDHELTATGLLELGHLAFAQGQFQAAATYFLEATFAAAAFDQYDLMQDAFRAGLVTHLVSGQKGIYRPLAPAAAWARRYSRALQADLLLMAAENYAAMGQTTQAARLLAQARGAAGTREMRSGMFGARFTYLSALVDFQRGNLAAGTSELASALSFLKASSRRLFQIRLADQYYASGKSLRVADLLFRDVLREPTARDWSVEPMETLAVTATPHAEPLVHWLAVALERNDLEKAIEIGDRIRRHRFFSTLPLGGRLVALRWILEAPPDLLTQPARLQQQDLLARYPHYANLSKQAAAVRKQLEALPLAPENADEKRQQGRLFEQLVEASRAQELILRDIALRREPAERVFPPLGIVKDVQQAMPDGQLILGYLVTGRSITGFALAKEQHAVWEVGPTAKVTQQVAELLKRLGLADRKAPIDAEKLKDTSWRSASAQLLAQLSNNTTAADWAKYREVVIVPDGPLWYVPFEALHTAMDDTGQPLISQVQVRYVPTLGLANGERRTMPPDARTAVIVGKLLPGQDADVTAAAYEQIRQVLAGTTPFSASESLPAPSAYFGVACDRVVVLNDLESRARGPYGWSPMFAGRPKAGDSLEDWMALPWDSPAQLVLPGWHTPAESALKQGGTGSEVFLAACGLMASGTRSALLSRWSVGGQSTLDLVREYIQELPYVPAAEAWQRSVRLARSNPLDPELEPRMSGSGFDEALTAEHPFFWAGYLLVDTGGAPQRRDE